MGKRGDCSDKLLIYCPVYPSSGGDNTSRQKTQMVSKWFLEHENEFTVLKQNTFGMQCNRTSNHGCAADKSAGIMPTIY